MIKPAARGYYRTPPFPTPSPRAGWGTALMAALPLLLTGCAASGTVYTVPLGGERISATKPLVGKVSPREAYYWTSDDGRLLIAIRFFKRNYIKEAFSEELLLVLELPDTPAGAAKDYKVNPRTLRSTYDAGYAHTRAHSVAGIVAVWDYGEKTLRGRFRLSVRQQAFTVLTGWFGNAPLLYTGEFSATENPQAGAAILARVDEKLEVGSATQRQD